MGKKGVALTTGGSLGTLGYLAGKLTPGDVKQLAIELLVVFKQQGPYALYSLLITAIVIGMIVWAVSSIVKSKQDEIDRISDQRDKFQKLIIADWKSTRGGRQQ